ncbi:hypothetical protein PTKIN_Ptkin19aG0015600 [Pterospermum kingtungense]
MLLTSCCQLPLNSKMCLQDINKRIHLTLDYLERIGKRLSLCVHFLRSSMKSPVSFQGVNIQL